MASQAVIDAIDKSPWNRGLSGVDYVSDPCNVSMNGEAGVVIFDGIGDSTFEVHFLLTASGRQARDFIRKCFASIFENHGGELIYGLVPIENIPTKLMARWVGGRSCGERQTVNGPCELFVLSKDMWKGQNK